MKISIDLEKRIARVDEKKVKISEKSLEEAVDSFLQDVKCIFWNTADEKYRKIKKADKIISEYLTRYALKVYTCPYCKSENVDFHHIDRCADLPL